MLVSTKTALPAVIVLHLFAAGMVNLAATSGRFLDQLEEKRGHLTVVFHEWESPLKSRSVSAGTTRLAHKEMIGDFHRESGEGAGSRNRLEMDIVTPWA